MRITFSVPDDLAVRFLSTVPHRHRSRTIAALIEGELKKRDEQIADACRRANADPVLNTDMEEWQAFDDPLPDESTW